MSTFKPALPFFNITYSPDTDDISSPIIPSKAELFLIREVGDTALQALLDDMVEHQNDEFFMTIEQDTGSGYEPFWNGVILQDQIEEIEASLPYEVKITATDGLNFLKSQDYDNANDDTTIAPDTTSLLDILFNCIKKVPFIDYYQASDPLIVTDAQFWEDSQTFSTTGEPLSSLHYDVTNFKTTDESGGQTTTSYVSAYDVLSEMATAFLCRLYQSGGRFRFESITDKENTTIKQIVYRKNGNVFSSGLVNVTKTISNNSFGSYIGRDNLKLKLPALKQVIIAQKTNNSANENKYIVDDSNSPRVLDFGIFDANEKAIFNFKFRGNFSGIFNQDKFAFIKLTIEMKATPIVGSAVYYNGSSWGSTQVTFDRRSNTGFIEGDDPNATYGAISNTFAVSPPPLPSASRIELTVTYDGVFGKTISMAMTTSLLSTQVSSGTFTDNQQVEVSKEDSTDEDKDLIEIMASDNDNIDINDKEIFDYGELQFGDGGLHTGRIMHKGTSKTTADTWSYKNESQDVRLFKLLTKERLSLQSRPVEIYDGTLGYIEGYFKTIVKDSKNLLPMDITFNAFDANMQGRWYVLQKNTSNINPRDIDREEKDYLKDDRGSRGDGFISGKFVVQGDEDGGGRLGDGLYYDGVESEQTSLEKFNLNKGFKAKINTLTYTATGQSQAITEEMHLVHIDTTGENFDVDATLPASADVQGQEFIIITDKDNHTGSVITLVPQAGDTIDNSSDYDLQHASDKVVLRCIGTNYYVE